MTRSGQKALDIRTFSAEELKPSTGSPVEEFSPESAERVAGLVDRFNGIYLQHPAHKQLFARLDYLRGLGNVGRGPKLAIRCVGKSSAGKSTALTQYAAIVHQRAGGREAERPVLMVKLDRACTTKRLIAGCLDMYGDEYLETSVESTLRKRLYMCIRRFKTELVVIDEIQHLNFRTSERDDPTDMLKRMLDDAVVPLVFAGDETALPMLKRNIQLANRMIAPCDFRPLEKEDPNDAKTFRSFVQRLDQKMVELEITRGSSNLTDPRTLACLFAISSGLLGRVINLVRASLEVSARRGADFIELCDLSAGTRAWAIEQDIIAYNPFERGLPDV